MINLTMSVRGHRGRHTDELAQQAGAARQDSHADRQLRGSGALHGGGLACLARLRADLEVGLLRIAIPPPVPSASIWLVVHCGNRQVPRLSAALTHTTGHVRQLAPRLNSADAAEEADAASLAGA